MPQHHLLRLSSSRTLPNPAHIQRPIHPIKAPHPAHIVSIISKFIPRKAVFAGIGQGGCGVRKEVEVLAFPA
ncbi:hypothetical protein NMY22_g16985 [Coprinellus aureogranulatus]|nr:hypothetical protein NMY22_g16985 [Coprinellus aureogranulatus]